MNQIELYLTLSRTAFSFGKQDWIKGEFQIEVLNLIPKQTENRLGTQKIPPFTHFDVDVD